MADGEEKTAISAPIGVTEKKQKTKKATVKKPRVQRVGHCNTCKHEWISRTGADGKPAKCPNCGSYDCTWRDQLSAAAPKEPAIIQPAQTMALTPPAQEPEPPKEEPKPEPAPEPPKEKKEVEVKQMTMKEAEAKLDKEHETIRQELGPGVSPGGLVIAVGVLALVGAGYFLIKSGKISLPQIKRETPKESQPIQETRQEAPRRPTPAPAPMTIQRLAFSRNLMGGRII